MIIGAGAGRVRAHSGSRVHGRGRACEWCVHANGVRDMTHPRISLSSRVHVVFLRNSEYT